MHVRNKLEDRITVSIPLFVTTESGNETKLAKRGVDSLELKRTDVAGQKSSRRKNGNNGVFSNEYMAQGRYVSSHFWRDSYVERLDPSEKLLYLYLITNSETTLCGIYEMPLRLIASDTGFDKEMIMRMMERLERDRRMYYIEGWVILINAVKHHAISNKSIVAGIERELSNVPSHIIEEMHKRGTPYPLLVDGRFNLTLLYSTIPNASRNGEGKVIQSVEEKETLFNSFWVKYPRKVGKQVSWRWWSSRVITAEQCKAIIDAVERYKQTEQWKKDEKYIPHPHTFLNQGRYEDEIKEGVSTKAFKSYAAK